MRRACTDERALRERRGQLADSERAAFDAHLAMCESCRNTLAVGREFDRSDAPAFDDGARIRRLANVAEQWAKGGRVSRPSATVTMRRRTAMLIAAASCSSPEVATAELGGPRGPGVDRLFLASAAPRRPRRRLRPVLSPSRAPSLPSRLRRSRLRTTTSRARPSRPLPRAPLAARP